MTVVVLLTLVWTGICTPDWIDAAVLVSAATFGEEMILRSPWFSAAVSAMSSENVFRMLPSRDYTNDFIFKGLTLHAIIGRRVFETWIKMLDLLAAGLEVADLVTNEFEGLEHFHEAMGLLENREAMMMSPPMTVN